MTVHPKQRLDGSLVKRRRRRRIADPDWAKRVAEREQRIEDREARKDQQFERIIETMEALANGVTNKPETSGFVKVPDYNCGIYVDGVCLAQITGLPTLQPAQDLLSGLVLKHVGAREFQLVLTKAEK